jgi:hypothetical protein
MRSLLLGVWLLAALGCITPGADKQGTGDKIIPRMANVIAPVEPEQVTTTNAREVARRLTDELDREMQATVLGAPLEGKATERTR